MNKQKKNTIISVFGKKGSGKTYFVKKKLKRHFRRKLILDTQNEYVDSVETFLRNKNNYVLNDFDFEYFINCVWQAPDFTAIVRINNFSSVMEWVSIADKIGYLSLFVEEIHLFDSKNRKDSLYNIFTTGRHRFINVIGTAQRFSTVSREMTSQSDVIISFRQTEQRDIKQAGDFIDNPERLKNLKVGEFLVLDGENKLNKILKVM